MPRLALWWIGLCPRRKPAQAREFEKWLTTLDGAPPAAELVAWSKWKGGQTELDAYAGHVSQKLLEPSRRIDLNIDRADVPVPKNAWIHQLTFEPTEASKNQEILDCKIETVRVRGETKEVRIQGCFLRTLRIESAKMAQLTIVNSWIERITFSVKSQLAVEIADSGIYRFDCPAGDGNPFRGPFVIRRTWIARDPALKGDAQQFRNIRIQLAKLGIVPAAGAFHAVELALDRSNEGFVARIFSWLYEIFNDFGNSISRPLAWFVTVWLVMAAIVYFGGAVRASDPGALAGWQRELIADPLLKAATYPPQAIFNPLGVLGRSLLVAKSSLWAIPLTVLSLWGTASIFFLLLALRRRFRLSD